MSNDSRDAFEEKYKADWDDPYMHIVREIWESAWQAAQSRHAAEREALVEKLRDMPFVTIEQKSRFRDEVFALLSDSGSQG